MHLGQLAGDLVERDVHEAVELNLAHRSVAADRQPDRGAHDAAFGQRGVDDPVVAERLLQAIGNSEHAAQSADVLTHEQHAVVVLQAAAQTVVDGLRERQLHGSALVVHE